MSEGVITTCVQQKNQIPVQRGHQAGQSLDLEEDVFAGKDRKNFNARQQKGLGEANDELRRFVQ
jgi:hypothetical protein